MRNQNLDFRSSQFVNEIVAYPAFVWLYFYVQREDEDLGHARTEAQKVLLLQQDCI